jgi:uncharacterized membrane protein YhaH (DUF805 family)
MKKTKQRNIPEDKSSYSPRISRSDFLCFFHVSVIIAVVIARVNVCGGVHHKAFIEI